MCSYAHTRVFASPQISPGVSSWMESTGQRESWPFQWSEAFAVVRGERGNFLLSLLHKKQQELKPVMPGKTLVTGKRGCFSCDRAGYSQVRTLVFHQEQPEAPKQTALQDLWAGSVPSLVDLNLYAEDIRGCAVHPGVSKAASDFTAIGLHPIVPLVLLLQTAKNWRLRETWIN